MKVALSGGVVTGGSFRYLEVLWCTGLVVFRLLHRMTNKFWKKLVSQNVILELLQQLRTKQ